MDSINYVSLVTEIIKPIVSHPNEVVVKQTSFNDGVCKLEVYVNQDDIGRVIGKKGRVASSIRTIVHAAAIRAHQNVEIEFVESLEEQN